jgi:serine/threonine protein kinase
LASPQEAKDWKIADKMPEVDLGSNLDDLVKKYGPLPEACLVHILRQVCGSLAEAHAAGLVHRDIKPANIFLTCRGGLHNFVKVLDFGLVKFFARFLALRQILDSGFPRSFVGHYESRPNLLTRSSVQG